MQMGLSSFFACYTEWSPPNKRKSQHILLLDQNELQFAYLSLVKMLANTLDPVTQRIAISVADITET